MKRILLPWLCAIMLLFSFAVNAQEWTARQTTIAANDSLITVTCPDGFFLSGIKFDSTLTTGTTTIEVLVPGDGLNTTYDPLWYGTTAYTVTIDSVKKGVSFQFDVLKVWQDLKLRLNIKQTSIKGVSLRFSKP